MDIEIVLKAWLTDANVEKLLIDAYESSLKVNISEDSSLEIVAITELGNLFHGYVYRREGEYPVEDEEYLKIQNSYTLIEFPWVNVANKVRLSCDNKIDALSSWARKERIKIPVQNDGKKENDYLQRLTTLIDLSNKGITSEYIIAEKCRSILLSAFSSYETWENILSDLREKYEQSRPNLARNIRKLRENAGLTQENLASRIGSSQSQIAKYERKDQVPSAERIYDIAWACDVDPGDLFLKDTDESES